MTYKQDAVNGEITECTRSTGVRVDETTTEPVDTLAACTAAMIAQFGCPEQHRFSREKAVRAAA